MKKLLISLTFPLLLLISCKGKNSYTIETFYSENKSNGDTMMVSKKDVITADSDSAAFVKAQEKFNSLMSKSGDNNGMPVKFTIRNHNGDFITGPGLNKDVQEQMYPNQKP